MQYGSKREGLNISIKEEDMEWAKRGFIGCLRNEEDVRSINQKLINEGIVTLKAIPMGGEKVFIKIGEDEDLCSLKKDYDSVLNQMFSVIRKWETRDVGGARYMWCRMIGVPIHAWRRNVFSILSNSIGRFIKLDPVTEDLQRLDVARVYVRTPYTDFINKMVNIQINNEHFRIRITEEICECAYRENERNNLEWSNQDSEDDDEDSDSSFIPPSLVASEEDEDRERMLIIGDNLLRHSKLIEDERLENKQTSKRREELIQEVNNDGEGEDADIDGNHDAVVQEIHGKINKPHTPSQNGFKTLEVEKEFRGPTINGAGDNIMAEFNMPMRNSQAKSPTQDTSLNLTGDQNIDPAQLTVLNKAAATSILEPPNPKATSEAHVAESSRRGEERHRRGKEHVNVNQEQNESNTSKDRRRRRRDILREKKKMWIKRKKEKNQRCSCKHKKGLQKQVRSADESDLIGDEADRDNWRLIHGDAREIAKDVWDLGKDFGLIHKGEEGELVQELISGVRKGAEADQV
ncbi:uncharacterized protein LOC131633263 [Vicia villosa]|uniref:uncharacterized protein LOC131633263 n=1 Tax=Vicia villosa TaxID=3911 RepID=UPI00273BA436|nr:uncharacterized protein LOC131633263 [Vicia villosa]